MAATSACRVPSGECCFSIASYAERDVVRHASSGPYSDLTCDLRRELRCVGNLLKSACFAASQQNLLL